MKKNYILKLRLFISIIMVVIFVQCFSQDVYADSSIKLVIDGNNVTSSAEPIIKNDRTLVPLRIIAEQLGAQVIWNNDDRTVEIIKNDTSVLLRIDSNLIEYQNIDKTYNLSDIAPQIIKDRTYVPIRLVSNALGVGVNWDNNERSVYVDSSETSTISPFFDMEISSINSGQVVTGRSDLQSVLPSVLPNDSSEIRYLLINPADAKGFVIARGIDLSSTFEWLPSMKDNGDKVLIAAIYDSNGKFLAGDCIPVKVDIIPEVSLTGLTTNQLVTADRVPLGANLNFSASYVKYEIDNPDNGAVYISPQLDPEGTFNMIPVMEDNGNMLVKVIAYDSNDNAYPSQEVNVKVEVTRRLSLTGVSSGSSIDGLVTLSASRNFNVTETEYVMKDSKTGVETILVHLSYGGYSWFPSPNLSGSKEVYVRVKDTSGVTYTSSPIYVNVVGTPKMLLQGIGPNQVATGAITLKTLSNVNFDKIKYTLINTKTGQEKVIFDGYESSDYIYTPVKGDAGTWKIRADGIYDGNKSIKSDEIQFTIYTDKIYTALPLIEKSKFLSMASEFAVDGWKKTGMSAALQTAQAILETGWGQSVPVDKYDGQFSYNLFGIKGSSTNGSVTSNTWEEYNGVSYRIDAEFRAYAGAKESWDDHNNLLLKLSRYEPFREVMHNSTEGAWSLKRCGYATDSAYPIKLMEIIKTYNLEELDKVGI